MKANINGILIEFLRIPKRYQRTNGTTVDGYQLRTDLHYEDGWREIIVPDFNILTHKLGNLKKEGDTVTYELIEIPPLTEEEVLKQSLDVIKSNYENHKQSGWDAYQDFRAKIVMDVENEIITEGQAFQIEATLGIAYDKISNTGDWKTAYFLLSQVSGFPEFIASYYDQAMIEISEYINSNY